MYPEFDPGQARMTYNSIMNIKAHAFTLPFVKKELVAKDTFAFYFDRSKEQWDFHPGQYVRMMLPHENPDDRGTMRYFTISSSPLDTQYLRITTEVIQSSFKKHMFDLKKGQEVSFFGPNGEFYFLEQEKGVHVFLAGGIGITPFLSMIEYAVAKNITTPIYLFDAFSTVEEMIFYDHLKEISKQHPNIHIIFTISHPDGSDWKGDTGRISEGLLKKYLQDVSIPLYYMVGPPPMVEASVKMVEELGVPEERILQEHFSGY